MPSIEPNSTGTPQANDPASLARLFGDADDLLPLWIAEPYVDLAPTVKAALTDRATAGWYGYETRPDALLEVFWEWMQSRHGWDGTGLQVTISPSIGTSIGVLMEMLTDEGDGVLLQPPVFTDFKPLVTRLHRSVAKNSLLLTSDGYRMDLDDLEAKASDPSTKMMVLCNPHNPVGRVWSAGELGAVARICAQHDVFVLADEIHADIILPSASFTPFATVAADTGVRWAATHGPIKTFGLAGVCDTLIVTDDGDLTDQLRKRSSQLHLTRNNVFGVAAFEAGYRSGGVWLDGFIGQLTENYRTLRESLPNGIELIEPDGTYLAWLDFRDLGMDVPELSRWLPNEAGLALSPGHWFGREGAGFARMTVAAPSDVITEAARRLTAATH
ncbi:MAG: aminotransferase class I/II-fold pyridoxal phosphate-dependent enzyme [Actinomycetota bacterium]